MSLMTDLQKFGAAKWHERYLSQSVQAATAKVPQIGWFKQKTFISHSCRGWKAEIRVPAGLGSQ